VRVPAYRATARWAGLARPAGAHHPKARRAEEEIFCAVRRSPPAAIPLWGIGRRGAGFWGLNGGGGLRPPRAAPPPRARAFVPCAHLARPLVTERRRGGVGEN